MSRLSHERGSTTLWILALSLAMFLVGGIGVDLWRALSEYRQLAGIADAAAVAASSGIDVDFYRAEGQIRLDQDAAETLALEVIAAQPELPVLAEAPVVAIDGGNPARVLVVLRAEFDLTLLALAAPSEDVVITAEATADASLRP